MPLERETIDRLVQGEENAAAIAAARDTIRNGCVLFAGAGTSKTAGYPLWRELIKKMTDLLSEQEIDISAITSTDLLTAANQIYDCFSVNGLLPQYHAFLCRNFEPQPGQKLDLQKQLLSIPFRGIVTPNFDECFECAIHQMRPMRENISPRLQVDNNHARHVRQFFDSLHRRDQNLSVAHIHGVHDEPTHIILTANQYATAYGISQPELQAAPSSGSKGTWTLLRKTLWALLATQRLLFVGFGMTDPFIYSLMQFVGGDLWDLTTPTHYFVSGVSIETRDDPTRASRNLRNRLGVQTIFYEVTDDNHSALSERTSPMGRNRDKRRTFDQHNKRAIRTALMNIPRPVVITEIFEFCRADHTLIIGDPGTGKSWTMRELQRLGREQGIAVELIAIDSIYAEDEQELMAYLGLSTDLIDYFRRTNANPASKGLLLFDAFDAARSDKKRNLFLRLVRRCIAELSDVWRVVVSVRTFDAQKSHELMRLFPDRSSSTPRARVVSIPRLSDSEIMIAVTGDARLSAVFNRCPMELQQLLHVPFNLWLLEQIATSAPGANVSDLIYGGGASRPILVVPRLQRRLAGPKRNCITANCRRASCKQTAGELTTRRF